MYQTAASTEGVREADLLHIDVKQHARGANALADHRGGCVRYHEREADFQIASGHSRRRQNLDRLAIFGQEGVHFGGTFGGTLGGAGCPGVRGGRTSIPPQDLAYPFTRETVALADDRKRFPRLVKVAHLGGARLSVNLHGGDLRGAYHRRTIPLCRGKGVGS